MQNIGILELTRTTSGEISWAGIPLLCEKFEGRPFCNTKVTFGISGGGCRGIAVDKESGKRACMKMGTGGIGFGLGVDKYQVGQRPR